MTKPNELQTKIDRLEEKMAFQENTIEELNDALTQQQKLISKLQTQMAFLITKMKAMEPSNIANMSDETPPPHY